MQLEILSATGTIYKGDIELVQLPGSNGSFEVLNNHSPIISSLKQGKIKIIDKNKETKYIDINRGIIEVLDNKIIILI